MAGPPKRASSIERLCACASRAVGVIGGVDLTSPADEGVKAAKPCVVTPLVLTGAGESGGREETGVNPSPLKPIVVVVVVEAVE